MWLSSDTDLLLMWYRACHSCDSAVTQICYSCNTEPATHVTQQWHRSASQVTQCLSLMWLSSDTDLLVKWHTVPGTHVTQQWHRSASQVTHSACHSSDSAVTQICYSSDTQCLPLTWLSSATDLLLKWHTVPVTHVIQQWHRSANQVTHSAGDSSFVLHRVHRLCFAQTRGIGKAGTEQSLPL